MPNNEQLSLDIQYKKYEDEISKWKKFLSLPQYQISDDEIKQLLCLTMKQIRELSSLRIAEYTYVVNQYSIFLQDQANKCNMFLYWSTYSMKIIQQQDQHKLTKWIHSIELRKISLNYMSRKVEKIAESLHNICIGKNVERKYSEYNK